MDSLFLPTNLVKHAVVHPLGFKKLSKRSPVERNLKTYFRLPAMPPQHMVEERDRITRLMRFVRLDERKKGQHETKKLDGFMLLAACEVDDPENALDGSLQDRNITEVVGEDMAFFTNLKFLDMSGNETRMEDFENLAALQELHLRCNGIDAIVINPNTFENVRILDLSFNQLTAAVFDELFKLPNLEKLDISGNIIKKLPPSLEQFTKLTHLSLEANGLTGEGAVLACGTIPNLVDLNLSSNKLKQIPKAPSGCFQQLNRLAIAQNQFEYFEDLFPLTTFPELSVVLVFGNPRLSRKDLEILNYELNQNDILLVNENPIKPAQKISKFYVSNSKKMIRIDARDPVREQILKKRRERAQLLKNNRINAFTDPLTDMSLPKGENRPISPDSFFITGAAGLLNGGPQDDLEALAAEGLDDLYNDIPKDTRKRKFNYENKEWMLRTRPHAATARGAMRELRQLLSKNVTLKIGEAHYNQTTKAAESRMNAATKTRDAVHAMSR